MSTTWWMSRRNCCGRLLQRENESTRRSLLVSIDLMEKDCRKSMLRYWLSQGPRGGPNRLSGSSLHLVVFAWRGMQRWTASVIRLSQSPFSWESAVRRKTLSLVGFSLGDDLRQIYFGISNIVSGKPQIAQAQNMSASYATVEKYKDLYGRKTVYFRG